MTIHELLQAAGLTANDEIPIWDADGTGEPTKKITAQQLAAAVVALANLVTSVNNQTGAVSITPANIGAVAKSGDTMTGPLSITPPTGEGGEIVLDAPGDDATKNGITIDNNGGIFRIFGTPSKDGTTHTGYGTTMAYNPYIGVLYSQSGPLTLAISNLQLSNPLDIPYGGTGATTPAQARANLELTPSIPQTIASGIYITKVGNLAIIYFSGNVATTLPPATWVTIGSLPNGYGSSYSFYGTALNGAGAEQHGIVHIEDTGAIRYYNSGTEQTTALWGSIVFPIPNN